MGLKCWVVYAVLLLSFFFISSSFAGPKGEKPAGFSARFAAGAGYMASTDQLKPNDGNKRVKDLDDNANWFDQVIPLAIFDLRYTFAESGRQVYFGTPFRTEGTPGLTLGAVFPFDDGGNIDIGAYVKPFGQVWEDPYIVDKDRHETDERIYGMKIDYAAIRGTGFETGYTLARIDIDDDEIGDRFDDLERDGWVHKIRLGYAFQLGRGLVLVPSGGFAVGDLDGDANRYLGYQFKVGLRRFTFDYLLNLTAGVDYQNYDDDHPIFDKDREDVTFSVFGMFTRPNLFGYASLFANLMAGYRSRNSNIDFLEANTVISGLMIGYKF